MKTLLEEIQEQVQKLHPAEVDELISWLKEIAPQQRKEWFEKFEAWIKLGQVSVIPGMTTDERMAMTRGED